MSEEPPAQEQTQAEPEMGQDEKMAKRMFQAMRSGMSPKKAAKFALDSDGDGVLSTRDLKAYRWTLVIFAAGILVGTLIMNPTWPVWIWVNHKWKIVAYVLGVLSGLFTYWMFKEEIEEVEDKVLDKVDGALDAATD